MANALPKFNEIFILDAGHFDYVGSSEQNALLREKVERFFQGAINREYLRWYSQRLHRVMELLVFGHAGAKVLMFPTRDGRFWEYEQLGIVASLADKLQAGHLQLYCIEGLATETFYRIQHHPADRIRRHAAFEELYSERSSAADDAEKPP